MLSIAAKVKLNWKVWEIEGVISKRRQKITNFGSHKVRSTLLHPKGIAPLPCQASYLGLVLPSWSPFHSLKKPLTHNASHLNNHIGRPASRLLRGGGV